MFSNLNKIIGRNLDIISSISVIAIVAMIILPMPTQLLDMLLVFNITLAIVIVLLTMFTKDVLEFSVFPTLLLITTLYRLGLNISSTRLILSQGDAGQVIQAFGSFVTGDNYIVGTVIFIIIVVIQFIVITAGAGRVAEVGARFTLDAMPGKQMSIDADLNAGVIDDATAKQRRENLQREADFYGSMDGASKFVKGDAIAGIVIVLINFIGGVAIFMGQKGMPFGQAISTFGILTIGDGLVGQIPALLISIASGILVTRSASKTSFGDELATQLTSVPKVIAMASVILFVLGLIPQLPNVPFLIMSAASGGLSYLLYRDQKLKIEESERASQVVPINKESDKQPEDMVRYMQTEVLEIEIGYGLVGLADSSSGGELLARISSVRKQFAMDLGIIVQPIRIRDNLQLGADEYVIKIKGNEVARSIIYASKHLVMDPGSDVVNIEGISCIEPAFGLPAVWVDDAKKAQAELEGLTVIDPTTVMITHLSEIIRKNSMDLMGRQEIKMLLDMTRERNPAVVDELVPTYLSVGDIQKVIQNLLREQVPVRDFITILETLADYAPNVKDIELLTEYVRFKLGRSITKKYTGDSEVLDVITIHPEIEQKVHSSIQKSFHGSFPALDPDMSTKILSSIEGIITRNMYRGRPAVIIASPRIRAPFRKLIELTFSDLPVLSLNEIPNHVEIEGIGMVRADEN